jgi:hypothetical protein
VSIKKFKQNGASANDGVWFAFDANADNTIPRVKLAREGRSNKKWLATYRDTTKGVDTDELSTEADFAMGVEVFAKAVVLDWEHIQPNDDGVEVPFETSRVIALLSDPDWTDFYTDLKDKANDRKNFKAKEAEAKN